MNVFEVYFSVKPLKFLEVSVTRMTDSNLLSSGLFEIFKMKKCVLNLFSLDSVSSVSSVSFSEIYLSWIYQFLLTTNSI